jgi:AcrR family transcriptional regulator
LAAGRMISRRGRPRDASLDDRILDAALRHLAAKGYARLSIESIAEEAGVPKPTVYRRWKSKPDLATAALARLQSQEPFPLACTTRAELTRILENFRTNLLRPNGMAMIGTLLAEESHHPELLTFFRERIVGPRRRMLREALERGIERGDIDQKADLDCAVNLLVGSFYALYLTGRGIPKDWPRRTVGTVLAGIRT